MKRVLIVDDAIDLGRLLQDALKVSRGNTPITVVPSAEEALLEATRLKFDLLITDLRLPGMSGLDLVRKIRARQPEIKVILITALMPEDRLVRQKDEVMPDIFLRKPLSVSTFLDAVESLIGPEEAPAPAKPAGPAPDPMPAPPRPEESPALPVDRLVVEPAGGRAGELEMAGHTPEVQPGVQKITGPLDKSQAAAPAAEPAGVISPEQVAALLPAISEPPAQPEIESVSSILSGLRAGLAASAVILLDERGNIVEAAGDLPDQSLKDQMLPAVMAAVSAGSRVSYLFGDKSAGSVQAYRGGDFDLVFAPTGLHVFLVVLPTGRSALRLALAFEEVLTAQNNLAASLAAITPAAQADRTSFGEEAPVPFLMTRSLDEREILDGLNQRDERDSGLDLFEDMLVRSTGELRSTDADSFWEDATGQEKTDLSSPGILSYDQAQKLGLVKPDEET